MALSSFFKSTKKNLNGIRKNIIKRLSAGGHYETNSPYAHWGTTDKTSFDGTDNTLNQINILRTRSRNIYRNTAPGAAMVRELSNALLAQNGMQFRSLAMNASLSKEHKAARRVIDLLFKDWQDDRTICDYRGEWDFDQLKRMAVAHLVIDGECFIQLWPGRHGTALSIEIIDPPRIPINNISNVYPTASGVATRGGVEYDRDGRPLSYFVRDRFEQTQLFYSLSQDLGKKVPARNMIHARMPGLQDEYRGIPLIAPAHNLIKSAEDFVKAAARNATLNAQHFGAIEYSGTEMQQPAGTERVTDEKQTQKPPADAEAGQTDEEIEADQETRGDIYEDNRDDLRTLSLPPGSRWVETPNNFPSSAFASFNEGIARRIAAVTGIPYHRLFSDLKGVTYSSARVGEGAFQDWVSILHRHIVSSIMRRIFRVWIARSLLSGKIPKFDAQDFRRLSYHEWQQRHWRAIDPKKQAEADAIDLANSVTSSSQIIQKRGDKPEEIANQRKQDEILGLFASPQPKKDEKSDKDEDNDDDNNDKNDDDNNDNEEK